MAGTREGFTLIELLIVVVIIGILAAIAIPKFGQTRERAYYTALKSDLKNLTTQEEIYYGGANSGYKYTSNTTTLQFTPSPGVNLGTITLSTDEQGWAVAATHNALGTDEGCAIYVGNATPVATAGGTTPSTQGVPVCDK